MPIELKKITTHIYRSALKTLNYSTAVFSEINYPRSYSIRVNATRVLRDFIVIFLLIAQELYK